MEKACRCHSEPAKTETTSVRNVHLWRGFGERIYVGNVLEVAVNPYMNILILDGFLRDFPVMIDCHEMQKNRIQERAVQVVVMIVKKGEHKWTSSR